MAMTMPAPMAVPLAELYPSRASLLLACVTLVMALAGLWRPDQVMQFTRVALDGLGTQEAYAPTMDGGDRPAMDPSLASVVDPRPRLRQFFAKRPERAAVQPFEYEVQPDDTLDGIATRFGIDASALLWNNGLDSGDQLEVGDRLTVLPVRGVLHLVKPDETLASIADRYGARVEDLAAANALNQRDAVAAGQVIVVAGGRVPLPAAPAADPIRPLDAIAALVSAPEAVVQSLIPGLGAPAVPTPAATPTPSPDENLPDPPGASRSQREFIMSIVPGARESQRETGVPSSVTLAQAILESDWGRSRLTTEGKNLFGIKAFGHPGSAGVYDASTWEVSGGQNATVVAGFKAYTSLADSIVDHGHWFIDNSRYAPALAVKDDPRAFARAIADAGYATDPAYAPKLITLMDRFNLYAYDITPKGE
jgi:LysM repeat protein